MTRKQYVVGNWKMHKTAREATDFIEQLAPKIEGCLPQVFLAVPFTSIAQAYQFAKDTNIIIGAQNMNDAREGAFTGEISGIMLKEAGASFVLLGHSERRHLFGESSSFIHQKVLRALKDDLQPILCVGETLEEHEAKKKEKVLREQISLGLKTVAKDDGCKIILAYEPVWAIGTGKTATPELAQEAHHFCRNVLEEMFGKKVAEDISILYGGSVKPENATELMGGKDIDGVLVGGSSLDVEAFASIVLKSVKKRKKQ